ncbi:MAG: serine hydrolase [Legionella sp.]|nr:MAG: serine hydrolase [Legionella sp.]
MRFRLFLSAAVFKIKKYLPWCLIYLFSINGFAIGNEKDLLRKISSIEKNSKVIIGVSAILIEKNKMITHNGTKRFFMASTIKLPIAIAFLHRVDEKKDSLNRSMTLDFKNSVPGSGSLYHTFERRKTSVSMQRILKLMMIESDNSASDALLHAAKGPVYVTKRMGEIGFKNVIINRSILQILMDTNHVARSYLKTHHTVYLWKRIFNQTPLWQKVSAWQRFEKDIRDTITPNDMALLLVKLFKGQILSEESTNLLIHIMEQCRTGRHRIKGLLPHYVKVAHKTGTWGIDERKYINYPGAKNLYRFASDVGIITLPKNKGHIAIAIYVKSQSASDYPRNRAIALTSRAIYDHFMK